jgi:hypothetical protein
MENEYEERKRRERWGKTEEGKAATEISISYS